MNRKLGLLLLGGCTAAQPRANLWQPLEVLPEEAVRAVVVVRVPAPWWAPDFLIVNKFIDAIPDYAKVDGLEHKAFTISERREFGGIYLFDARPSAESWFGPAWFERVRRQRGVEGDVLILDAPHTTVSSTPEGSALPMKAIRSDAVATLLLSHTVVPPDQRSETFEALAFVHGLAPETFRVYWVTTADGRVGAVTFFSSAAASREFWSSTRLRETERALGSETTLTYFSAPVLFDPRVAKEAAVKGSAQSTRVSSP
jgi:hypothetical protein